MVLRAPEPVRFISREHFDPGTVPQFDLPKAPVVPVDHPVPVQDRLDTRIPLNTSVTSVTERWCNDGPACLIPVHGLIRQPFSASAGLPPAPARQD
jgi:hypothetical protein